MLKTVEKPTEIGGEVIIGCWSPHLGPKLLAPNIDGLPVHLAKIIKKYFEILFEKVFNIINIFKPFCERT